MYIYMYMYIYHIIVNYALFEPVLIGGSLTTESLVPIYYKSIETYSIVLSVLSHL